MKPLFFFALAGALIAAEAVVPGTPPISVSTTEITQAEYSRVTGSNPSIRRGSNLPVENVTWWDAIRYCNLRSIQEGLEPACNLSTGACDRSSKGYRLLTDEEWTRAAGAPTKDAHLGPAQTKEAKVLAEVLKNTGAQPVGTLQPNQHGLFDMTGNVWEWVQDAYSPDPSFPAIASARVIRGGSFLTTTSSWSKGYRSSMEPDRRSRFTGFRVCRTLPSQEEPETSWIKQFQAAPEGFAGATGALSSLAAAQKDALRVKWTSILGLPNEPKPAPAVKLIAVNNEPEYTGKLMYLQTEPAHWEKIYLMLPNQPTPKRPLPVVIVPFYDVDTPAGRNLGGRRFSPDAHSDFAIQVVRRGFAAISIRWFGEGYGEHYAEAVANLATNHPGLTGLGKWVLDSRRLLDYLETLPEIDSTRIGMIGHSLGGKMTLYATAMDDRIRAAVSSEPGIGLTFSNYDDFWYLGEAIRTLDPGTDQHELLAMAAPRPFLLIGGDSSDTDHSWHYINAAKAVYSRFGAPDHIGYLNHRTGHAITPEAASKAMDWLQHFLTRKSP